MPCQPHEVWCSHPHFNSSRYWFTYDFGAHYVVEVVAVLSIIGSLLICTSFAVWPDLRRATSRHILVFLSVADLGASLTNAVGALDFVGEGDSCKAQAFSFVYWSLSFVLWSSCMAIYLYVSIVQDNVLKARGLLIPFHVVCWGLPLIMAVSALAAGALGQSSSGSTLGWCWVAVQPKHPSGIKCGSSLVLWMALTLKMWELLSYVVIPFLYFSVKCHIRKETSPAAKGVMSSALRRAVATVDKKLLIFPVVYVLLRMWGSIRVGIDWYMQTHPHKCHAIPADLYKAFVYLQAFGDNAQGCVNFILFFLCTNTIQQKVRRLIMNIKYRFSGGSELSSDDEGDDDDENGDNDADDKDKSFRMSTKLQRGAIASQSSSRPDSRLSERASLIQRDPHTQYGLTGSPDSQSAAVDRASLARLPKSPSGSYGSP